MHIRALDSRILVAQDDHKTAELLSNCLSREGFGCVFAQDEHETLDLAKKNRLCLVVLELTHMKAGDWELCRQVRSVSNVPILILSARGETGDVVKALGLGADDYVVKPFRLPELIARIKALVRRAGIRPAMHILSHGDITLDLNRRCVTREGRRVALTSSELRILEVLMSAPGRVFSRSELLLYLYPSGGVVIERVVDVHVQKLRAKLEQDRAHPRYILTARGLGYRFADAEGPAETASAEEGRSERRSSEQSDFAHSGAVADIDRRADMRSSHDSRRGATGRHLTSLIRKSI